MVKKVSGKKVVGVVVAVATGLAGGLYCINKKRKSEGGLRSRAVKKLSAIKKSLAKAEVVEKDKIVIEEVGKPVDGKEETAVTGKKTGKQVRGVQEKEEKPKKK